MNNYAGIGRLTKDIELKQTDGGKTFARFNIAIDRGKDKEGNDRGADFPSCVAFGKTAELLQRFSGKGLRVLVIGHIKTGSYEDTETGKKVYTSDIVADRVEFIDWKQKDGQNVNQGGSDGIPEGFHAIQDEMIPF